MEKMIFVVRKAVEEDIPDILSITKEAFKMYAESAGITGNMPSLEETSDEVKRDIETKECYVALIDGVVVGSVRVEVRADNTAYLSRFGVETSFQSRGVGTVLMNAVDEGMINLNVNRLYLHTASKILSLVRFYYGRGFYIDSTTKDRGYIRALLCKEYDSERTTCVSRMYQNCAV